jgi:hypothetical protein
MRLPALIVVSLPLILAGCMASTSATLVTQPEHKEIQVVRTMTGLVWGPCMPTAGKRSVAYAFDFDGEKNRYSEKDFRVYRQTDQGPRVLVTGTTGTITINPTAHRVVIDLQRNGERFEANGDYPFHQEKSAN